MAQLGHILGKPVHGTTAPDANLIIPDGKVGIEIETEGWRGDGAALVQDKWDYHEDHSLRNRGMEFTTKGQGIVGADIANTVYTFCDWAKKRKLSVGYPRAGIHIHLDCTDLDFERGDLAVMTSLYLLLEHMMFGFAGAWRGDVGFCDPLAVSYNTVQTLREALYSPKNAARYLSTRLAKLDRYFGYNLKSLTKYGTVEFRHLETTYDADRILNWINIIFQIKKAAMEWDHSSNPLMLCSKLGPRAFVERIAGPTWKHLAPFYSEEHVWAQIDNAVVLMSDTDPPDGKAIDYKNVTNKVTAKPNPLLTGRGKSKDTAKKSPGERLADMDRRVAEDQAAPEPAAANAPLERQWWETNEQFVQRARAAIIARNWGGQAAAEVMQQQHGGAAGVDGNNFWIQNGMRNPFDGNI